MRILKKDLRHGLICIAVEDIDDLWVLYNIVESKDLITTKTTREIKIETGRPSSRRVSLTLTLETVKIEFDTSSNRLRIIGVIVKCPEEYEVKGSHHSLVVTPNSIVTIFKEHWYNHHLNRLESSVKSREPIVILSVDADSAGIAIIRSYKVDLKAELRPHLPGKRDIEARSVAEMKFFNDLTQALSRVIQFEDPKPEKILITGPGFWKNHFKEILIKKNPDLAIKVVGVKGGSIGGAAGIYEAMRSGVFASVIKDSRIADEISSVEDLFARLGADQGDVSYGLDQVAKDAVSGAIEKLLLTENMLRISEIHNRIEEIIREVENRKGKIMIISTEHEGGYKLSSLGGVAAILRYKRYRR